MIHYIVSIAMLLIPSAYAEEVIHLKDAKSVSCLSPLTGEAFAMSFPDIQFDPTNVDYGVVKYFYLSPSGDLRVATTPPEQQTRFVVGQRYALQLLDHNWRALAYFEFREADENSQTRGDIEVYYRTDAPNPNRFLCQFDSEAIDW